MKNRIKFQHSDYKFSVTIQTDDLPLVFCLRGLSVCCQKTENPKIPHGGTEEENWKSDNHKVTFHFNRADYRENFVSEGKRLLPDGWTVIATSDNDPQKPSKNAVKRAVHKHLMDELLA